MYVYVVHDSYPMLIHSLFLDSSIVMALMHNIVAISISENEKRTTRKDNIRALHRPATA